MLIGYARVSMNHQNIEPQIKALQAAGCEKIFEEKKSGTYSHRPILAECLQFLREGDGLVVTRLDRLARSVVDLNKMVGDLDERAISFKVLEQDIDLDNPVGRLMFNLLAILAEFERETMLERQALGIKNAQDKGIKFGRNKKLSEEEKLALQEDYDKRMSIKAICEKYGISRATFYRYNNREEEADD